MVYTDNPSGEEVTLIGLAEDAIVGVLSAVNLPKTIALQLVVGFGLVPQHVPTSVILEFPFDTMFAPKLALEEVTDPKVDINKVGTSAATATEDELFMRQYFNEPLFAHKTKFFGLELLYGVYVKEFEPLDFRQTVLLTGDELQSTPSGYPSSLLETLCTFS